MEQKVSDSGEDQISEQTIFRALYLDPTTILLQVAMVGLVAFDYIYTGTLIKTYERVFAAAIIISLLTIFLPRLPVVGKKIRSYFVYIPFHVMAAVFIILVAPVGSAYELLLLLLIFTSTFWYGLQAFVLSWLACSFMLMAALVVQKEVINSSDLYEVWLKIALLGLVGGIFQRLQSVNTKERGDLVRVSRYASVEHLRLQSLINSMADAVIAVDQDENVLVYNGAALDLLNTNLTLDERPIADVVKIYTKDRKPVNIFEQTRQAQTIIKRDDLLLKVSESEYLNLYVSVAEIQRGFGDEGVDGFIMLLRDITKEKSIEEQRDEFISVVSHELRTPIAITEANISTAMLPDVIKDKEKVMENLEQSHRNILFLADMVNDITTLAHAERGDLDAQIEDVFPASIVKELNDTYTKEAAEKGLKIKSTVDSATPKSIKSNNYRVKEILQNYVTNAIKYSDSGTITISAVPKDNGVRFAVQDMGAGMTSSDQHHVFEKFWRSEDFRTKAHKGTGLGLYISKKLAERMKGSVGLTSEINKGSVFYLDLPLMISPPKETK